MPHDNGGLVLAAGDAVHVIPQQMAGEVMQLIGCEVLVRQANGEIWLHPGFEVQRQRAA